MRPQKIPVKQQHQGNVAIGTPKVRSKAARESSKCEATSKNSTRTFLIGFFSNI